MNVHVFSNFSHDLDDPTKLKLSQAGCLHVIGYILIQSKHIPYVYLTFKGKISQGMESASFKLI